MPRPESATRRGRQLFTLVVAALGVGLFWLLDLPLPFLLGPLFACLVFAIGGAGLADSGRIGVLMRTVLGVAVGSSITPDLLSRLPGMAYSVALVPLFVLIIGLVGYPFFRRVCGFDGPTSYYAAMPGGFQDMVIFGQEAGADIRALSLIHATRVLLIVTLVPFLMTSIYGQPLANAPGAALADIPWRELVLMAVAALVGWKGGERIGLFGASIIGPLVVAAAFSLLGLVEHRPPALAILAAQFFIGASIGAKYTGVSWRELRVDVMAGAAFCVLLAVVAAIFAEAVALAGFAPAVEALLSFAPGGQAEMAVLTIIAGADLAFVVTHHVARMVVVIAGAPVVAHFLKWKDRE
ncbi:AbrB family transcriptional regulator [Aurantimonas marina]|uniref:AbrB family transcriptional regulator n=1 Tax=Aurantimonas marina TaxID=2780508 RepID=UPI001E4D132C|nr:AbrB family transcriptional regulator [Aurantimonas marina]